MSIWRDLPTPRPSGRRGLRFVSATLLLVAAWLAPATAFAAYDPTLEIRLAAALERGAGDEAIRLLEDALKDNDDPLVRQGLMEKLAELRAQAGQSAAAGEAYAQLAGLIDQREDKDAAELISIWRKAAAEFGKAGDTARMAEALQKALELAAAAGLADEGEEIAALLDPVASTPGGGPLADKARAALDAFETSRAALEESSRGFEIDESGDFSTVKIYYATDRARTGSEKPADFYGGDRGALELGTATVSIPLHHKPGQIEAPSIWTFDFREDPARHIVLSSVIPKADEAVFAEMRAQAAETGSKDAFVFVHGFNVPFNEAAMRTAQMAYDMNFDGLPILYSWPSRASLLSYIADTAVVNFSGRRLSRFLDDLVAKSGATRIHLIAHSMGNRALTDALELFALRHKGEPPAFDQVLFTAPDLDAGLFGEMVETIRTTANRITLYASNKDWALAVSRQLHGDAPRAGQGGKSIVHVAAVDSIDMTSIGEDMLKHSYYANNPSALTDILSLFWRDAPPEKRCGMTETTGDNGEFWQYSPEQCDGDALLSALAYLRKGSVKTESEARAFMNRFIVPANIDPNERTRLESALKKLFGK